MHIRARARGDRGFPETPSRVALQRGSDDRCHLLGAAADHVTAESDLQQRPALREILHLVERDILVRNPEGG
ncbi:MAG TPA: hypothetical protein VK714_16200 [Myxococcota bacterium]|nr:hypothetical protein [Myxococcota bacterium]